MYKYNLKNLYNLSKLSTSNSKVLLKDNFVLQNEEETYNEDTRLKRYICLTF